MTTDIICAVHNGARYLDDLFLSLQAQTVSDWRCWVRDDASSDDSADRVASWAARDPRIVLLHRGAPSLGGPGAFGWLIERLPADAQVICCVDYDDVWLPERLAVGLAALKVAEASSAGPVLVHTDLDIVDASLRSLHPSFWRAAGIQVEPSDVRRIAVDNIVTTSTITMNRALVDLLGPHAPKEVAHPDAWFALAAAAFGRIVALPEVTVRYRQHGQNIIGALDRASRGERSLFAKLRRAITHGAVYRTQLARSCALAAVFVERFGARLNADDRAFLLEYAALPSSGALARKFGVLRLRARPGRSLLGAFGEFLRA